MNAVTPARVAHWAAAVLLTLTCNLASAITTGQKPVPPRADGQQVAAPADTTITATQIFDDAVRLKAFIANNQNTQAVALLKAYGVSVGQIAKAPFLNKIAYFQTRAFIGSTGTPAKVGAPEGVPLSGLGAGDVADALGSLIAERFKQEAEMEALHALGKKILQLDCGYVSRPLSKSFPTTVGYLQTLESNPGPQPCPPKELRPVVVNDWAVLQSSFKVDVAALPDNLPAFLDSLYDGKVRIPAVPVSQDTKDARYLTWLASTTAGRIYKNGKNPYQLIDEAVDASDTFWKQKHIVDNGSSSVIANVATGLRVLSILSHMLTQNASSQWRSAKEIQQFLTPQTCPTPPGSCVNNVSSNDSAFLLLGLSFARDQALYGAVDTWLTARGQPTIEALDAAASTDAGKLATYIAMIQGVLNQTLILASSLEPVYQHVQDIPTKLSSLSEARPLVGDLGAAAIAASGVVETFIQMKPVSEADLAATTCVPNDSFCAARQRIRGTTTELQYGFDIIGEIKTQQYAAAVGELIAYVGTYLAANSPDSSKDYGNFFSDNGAFIAAVASAQSTADLKAALDDYSLPAGSYTQQQTTKFSITLNSFFGAGLGAETLTGNLQGTGTAKTRMRLGFAAPVGIDFNFGVADTSKPSNGHFFETGAWSVFVPVLDVGAVASWRLGSGGGSVAAITWQNIVAPGLYVVWSKRDSPFSILLGAQYGPELRKISAGGDTIEKAAIQFPSLEFVFNIPIFNLYRRPE